jgi:nucleoside-diphosphate-sugar epimerase
MGAERGRRDVVLTGASGYLGGLIAATLLAEDDVRIMALVRAPFEFARLFAPIRAEIEVSGRHFDPEYYRRFIPVTLPSVERLIELDPVIAEFGARQLIHCAGCLDYFNREALEGVNVRFTSALMDAARRWRFERVTYISSAFSSGYMDDLVPERLHDRPGRDPTDYTRTKREAEAIVAASGLPYLILRPAIVIGDSHDGHYSGKQYGLYQLWAGMERLLCREWQPEMHVLGARQAVPLVHQDAFQAAFLAAYRHLPDRSIVNLVSRESTLPDLRTLWDMWMKECMRPRTVIYYDRMQDIPIRDINSKQRALLALGSVNLQIASHPWRYETANMETLRAGGLVFRDATIDSVSVCQELFVAESSHLQKFIAEHPHIFADRVALRMHASFVIPPPWSIGVGEQK